MSKPPYDYTVEIDHAHPPETPVGGCGCDGPNRTLAEVAEIGDCSLTPGDPSPAGRCPDCDGLVYVDTPKARAMDAAPAMLAELEALLPLITSEWGAASIAVRSARAVIAAAKGESR